MKRFMLLQTLLIFFICGCTSEKKHTIIEENGIKITDNLNDPSKPDLIVNLNKKVAIELDSVGSYSKLVPYKKNYYILDKKYHCIVKYNESGDFVKRIGRAGKGPGEFESLSDIFIDNDTIYASDRQSAKINKISLKGNYISCKKYDSQKTIPGRLRRINSSFSIGFSNVGDFIDGGRKIKFTQEIDRYDNSLNIINNIYKDGAIISVMDYLNLTSRNDFKFTTIGKRVFVALNDDTKYQVNAYDMESGKKVEVINKKYRKIKMNESDLEEMKKDGTVTLNGEKPAGKVKIKEKYFYSINGIYSFKNKYLFVERPPN